MPVDLVATFHLFSRFLASGEGQFFRSCLESLILFLVCYMVTSEYRREGSEDLKLMLVAFAALLLDSLLFVTGLGLLLFGGAGGLVAFLPAIDSVLEMAGIIVLTNAFLLPRIRERVQQKLNYELGALIAATLGVLTLTFLTTVPLAPRLVFGVAAALEIAIMLYAGLWIAMRPRSFGKYSPQVATAFLTYAVAPLLNLVNIAFYGGGASRLSLLAFPFPIIAILLLFRVVYLKLADKVSLKERLHRTTRLYEHERAVSRMKDEFVDIVSHELRTPLTSISLYTGLLKKQGLDDRSAKMVDVIKDESARLGRLVNDTLDLSRLENGRVQLRLARVGLRSLVERAAAPTLAQDKGLRVVNRVPASLRVRVDPDRFAQVLINLYGNAIKFTPAGGTVTFSARAEGGGFSCAVADTGVGIPKEKQARIFEKFYQVQPHMTRSHQGTGLGLAIAKRIVELHGGAITVESRVGQGSTFRVRVPNTPGKLQARAREPI